MKQLGVENSNRWSVVVRDLMIFQLKLALDGLKDLFLAQIAVAATMLDFAVDRGRPGRRFYAVVRTSERFDLWLNLHGAARDAEDHTEGLFGVSRAGADTLLGKLEQCLVGMEHESPARSGSEAA